MNIVIVVFFSIPVCAAQDVAGVRIEKAFVADINDSIQVEVKVRYDEQGSPEVYFTHINTPVCEDGLCKLMAIDLYWDVLGNFLKYKVPAGEPLTKADHLEFTGEDHRKLNTILSNSASILRDYPAGDLIVKQLPGGKRSKDVDAVTAATRADIKDAVVSGAAYSTYVLWHIVNGPIASQVAQHAQAWLTDERIAQMFYSDNLYYQYYALNTLAVKDSVRYLDQVLYLVKNGLEYIPYFAIERVPRSAWQDPSRQASLLQYFDSADFELQNEMLNRASKVVLFAGSLDYLVSAIGTVRESQVSRIIDLLEANCERLNTNAMEALSGNRRVAPERIAALRKCGKNAARVNGRKK